MDGYGIRVENGDALVKAFGKFPEVTKGAVNKALRASILEIQKRTDDSGDSKLFHFKTPRALRTGYLARSFSFGIKFGDWYASIGPTANYAESVYFGKRGTPNPYTDRIAKDATDDIQRHFIEAGEVIMKALSL